MMGILLVSGFLSAQTSNGVAECSAEAVADAVVRGRLVPDPGEPVSHHGTVWLEGADASCSVVPNPGGTFEFRGVVPGPYRLSARMSAEFQRMAPVSFTVSAGATLHFDIPVRFVNPLPECVKQPRCASVLARRTMEELSSSDVEQVELLAYRVGIALAGEGWEEDEAWVACLEVSEELLVSIAEAYPLVAPRSECEPPDPRAAESRGHRSWRHGPTDRPARMIRLGQIESTSETSARVSLSYNIGLRWGSWYSCDLEWMGGLWTPRKCRLEGVS